MQDGPELGIRGLPSIPMQVAMWLLLGNCVKANAAHVRTSTTAMTQATTTPPHAMLLGIVLDNYF